MKLTADQERTIKAIMKKTDCPKDFECLASKFKILCQVNRRGDTNLIECQDADGKNCPMSFVFGEEMRFCSCAVRKYVATELDR